MKLLKTNKLFYNKWPIKVECLVKGSSKIARYGAEYTLLWCRGLHTYRESLSDQGIDKKSLRAFTEKVVGLLEGKDVQVRSEGSHYSIFLSDTSLLETIKKELKPWIYTITAPGSAEEFEYLKENGPKKVLCDQYPHGKFKFKLYIRDKLVPESRERFLSWLGNYPERVSIAPNTERWLSGEKRWVQDPFFYVEDEKMLSMTLLYLGDNIKSTRHFVLKSSINTSCPH